MSQGTELLNSLTEEEIAAYSVNPSTEEHIVVGSDRFITVPAALRRIAVEHDHNVETVIFDCPRFWDEHDLSQMAIYINYILSNGYTDSYLVDNVVVDDTDETIMHFEWTISRNVTQIKGAITFLICAKQTDEEGNETLHWNSEISSELTVSAGMECTEQIVEEHKDLITSLLTRMNTHEERVSARIEELRKSYEEAVPNFNFDPKDAGKMLLVGEEGEVVVGDKPSAGGGSGSGLPEVTEADNGKIPMVVGGQWENVSFPAGAQYYRQTVVVPANSWNDNGSMIHAVVYDFDKNLDDCHVACGLSASASKAEIVEAARCGVMGRTAEGTEVVLEALWAMPTIDLPFDFLITKPTTLAYSVDEASMTLTIMEDDGDE